MITTQNNSFEVPGSWTHRIKGAPDRTYSAKTRTWTVPNTSANRRFLLSNFLSTDFSPSALEAVKTAPAPAKVLDLPPPEWPADLLPHQVRALNKAWGKPAFFFAHDMGSGKSRTILELWKALYAAGRIDEAWVVCPNTLIDNWHDQIRLWASDIAHIISVYGVLSLSAGRLPLELTQRAHPRLAVAVDESQRIKNSSAKRSKVMATIGKHCGFRANLTGTNITKGIEDLYSQYNFLDPDLLGYKSFYSFRNRYCMMGGFESKQIVGYQNVAELMTLIEPVTDVVVRPVKLPPQTPETRHVEISTEQKRLLAELKSQMMTEMAGEKLTIVNALSYYTRGAQILGGFFPTSDPTRVVRLKDNAKMDELIEIVEGTSHKVVIFCKFVAEANMIFDELNGRGIGTLRIRAKDPTLQEQVEAFQTDDEHQCIVTTYASGALGFTLTRARILVEYSGTFNFEEAAQARKRIDRIGQEFETKAIRLLSKSKLDHAIKAIADRKQDLASYVNDALMNPSKLLDIME